MAALAAFALSACGGSSSSSSSSSTAASATQSAATIGTGTAKGSPVVIQSEAAVNTQLQNYPEIWAGAEAAALAINKQGGVNGHPIRIVTCNSQANPNGAEACARQAISDKAVADVAPTEIYSASVLPLLASAHIPYVGAVTEPIEKTSPDSFPITGGLIPPYGAILFHWASQGIKNVAITTQTTAAGEAIAKTIEPLFKAAGIHFAGLVTFPVGTTDFSPTVQQLKATGAQAVAAIIGGPITPAIEQATRQAGYNAQWAVVSTLGPAQLKQYGAAVDGTVVGTDFPPASSSLPGIKAFNADANTAAAAGVSNTDNRDDSMIASWAAINGLADVARTIKGAVTAPSLYAALRTANKVDIRGLVNWSPGATGPMVSPRTTNGSAWVSKAQNGTFVLLTPTAVDVFKLAASALQ